MRSRGIIDANVVEPLQMTRTSLSGGEKKSPRLKRRRVPAMKTVTELRADLDAMRGGMPDWPVRFEAAKNLTLLLLFGPIHLR